MNNKLISIALLFLCTNVFGQNLGTNLSCNENTNLFLNGEYIQTKGNDSIQLQTFKLLHKNNGFRILAIPIPISTAYFLQKYYETGNDSLFQSIVRKSKVPDYDEAYYYHKIYFDFYQSLPLEEKFMIHGIGIEYPEKMTIMALYDMFSKRDIPHELQNVYIEVSNLSKKAKLTYKDPFELSLKIRESIKMKEKLYKDIFKDDYYNISNIVEEILDLYANAKKNGLLVANETMINKYMCKQLLDIGKENPNAKIFIQMGFCFIAKNNCPECMKGLPLGFPLNTEINSPFKDRVENAIIYYKQKKKFKKGWTKEQQKFIENLPLEENMTVYKIQPTDILFSDKANSYDFIIVNGFK